MKYIYKKYMDIINKIGERMKRAKENYSFSNMDCNHENILTRLKMCWFYHFEFFIYLNLNSMARVGRMR